MKKVYRNVIRTKKLIRATFMELLEEKKDIEHISVSELTARADLSKSTFYYHYEDIFSVAEEIENELFEKLSNVLTEIKKEQTSKYDTPIKVVVAFLQENEDLYRKTLSSSYSQVFVEKLKFVLTKKMLEHPENFPATPNLNVHHIQARFLINAFVDTLADYFKGVLNLPLEDVGEIILKFIDRIIKKSFSE